MLKILATIAIGLAFISYPVEIVHKQATAITTAKSTTRQVLPAITLKQHLETPTISLGARQFHWDGNKAVDQQQEIECLAKNIYFEAAIESTAGKLAVAHVTHNKVVNKNFPNTYCKVVYQGRHHASGHPKRDQCQFSWYCDGKHDEPYQGRNWEHIQDLAQWYYVSHVRNQYLKDITDGATHYHADYIDDPRWSKYKRKTVQIDRHIFYR